MDSKILEQIKQWMEEIHVYGDWQAGYYSGLLLVRDYIIEQAEYDRRQKETK